MFLKTVLKVAQSTHQMTSVSQTETEAQSHLSVAHHACVSNRRGVICAEGRSA